MHLIEAGLTAFVDRYALPAGQPWQLWLERCLASCRALVVLVGGAFDEWQQRDIQLGLDRQASAAKAGQAFPVIPVLLPGLASDAAPLARFLNLNTLVDLRSGLDEPEALQRLVAGVQGAAINVAAAPAILNRSAATGLSIVQMVEAARACRRVKASAMDDGHGEASQSFEMPHGPRAARSRRARSPWRSDRTRERQVERQVERYIEQSRRDRERLMHERREEAIYRNIRERQFDRAESSRARLSAAAPGVVAPRHRWLEFPRHRWLDLRFVARVRRAIPLDRQFAVAQCNPSHARSAAGDRPRGRYRVRSSERGKTGTLPGSGVPRQNWRSRRHDAGGGACIGPDDVQALSRDTRRRTCLRRSSSISSWKRPTCVSRSLNKA